MAGVVKIYRDHGCDHAGTGNVILTGLRTARCCEIIGMQFLDFFDFLTNSVMMPIAAITICLLVSRVIGVKAVEEEVMHGEAAFRRKRYSIS